MKKILKDLVENINLPKDEFVDQDPEILEIFVEEIEEIIENVQPLLDQWLSDPSNAELLTVIRRNFHTLKGSGRMVGAKSSGELAWTVEDTLNRVIAKTISLSEPVQQYVSTVFNIYKFKLYDDFAKAQTHQLDLRPLVLLGQQIQQNTSIEPALEELLTLSARLNSSSILTGLEDSVDTEDAPVVVAEEPVVQVAEEEITAPVVTESPVTTPVQPEVIAPATASLENHKEGVDEAEDRRFLAETIAIFIEESEEHLASIDTFLSIEKHTSDHYNRLIRALHTLRGSSAMAHVDDVFQASSKVEQLFKILLKDDTQHSTNENALLTHYTEFVRDYLHTLGQDNASEQQSIIYQKFNEAWERYDFQTEYFESNEHQQDLVSQLVELDIEHLLDAEFDFDQRAKVDYPTYFESLLHEANVLIEHTDNRAAQGIHDISLALKVAYEHVLAEKSLLNTDYAFELFNQAHQEFIHLFDALASGQRVVLNESSQSVLEQLHDYVTQDIEQLEVETESSVELEPTTLEDEPVVQQIEAVAVSEPVSSSEFNSNQLFNLIAKDQQYLHSADSFKDFDEEVLDIFLEEADELLVGIDEDLTVWFAEPQNLTSLNNLMRYLHTLKGGANMVQAEHIGLIAHHLESIYERIIKQQITVNTALMQTIRMVQDEIAERIQVIREQGIDYPAINLLEILQAIEKQQPIPLSTTTNVGSNLVESFVEKEQVSTVEAVEAQAIADEQSVGSDTVSDEQLTENIAQDAFAEESEELLLNAHDILEKWFEERSSRSLLLQLQRIAHTLKGGAKMVNNSQVSDIAYELENTFERFGLHSFNSNAYDHLLSKAFDWLKNAILLDKYEHFDSIRNGLRNIQYVDVSAQLPEKITSSDVLWDNQAVEFIQGDGAEPPSMLGEWGQVEQAENNNEMIRISADLIEKMIDLSGENSINRSRIEMDLGQFGNTLSEMELAIQRLADQLRRMEGELESQIIAKHGDSNSRYADFDPLEMDQYSSLNQLSKSLAESASDLVDFKSTLAEKIRDTEGLLLQQARIQAEIQEGLMRTRLVPFTRLLPRLQRLVRQTASTLNRPTELIVHNTEGELDRNILEKLMSPLEHMLRNAIDHGIEETSVRERLNKPSTGQIELNISRQGTDVLVEFKDDGKGIDPKIIRAKALQNGLIQADQSLSDEEILQYIFHHGFSTAQQVTQISGRGVGLDVVQSEIKLLGGQVTVASTLGQGSIFTIRVPTTVAVSDALMVKVGDQQFAVPLSQIDRIVRIAPSTLEEYFHSKKQDFVIDQQPYNLRYLAEFVAHQPIPRFTGIAHSLPVLLIKNNSGKNTALLVDQLIGSRSQIVVKPIGKQFMSIGAVAGATILGDGQVCLILDAQNIARQTLSNKRQVTSDQRELSRNRDQRHLIMIVDDSVTVRKVTSRLLERHNFDVITAKDGVDAIEQLENVKPDLMLLDIEMPRMDGFEVTNWIRHHELHHELPIIMITSRTGEKHRERAFSLGVTNYMGKPFQEAELLENIQNLLVAQ
ncbi:Hpt domain-containing protein [Acinetobacter sp. CFCC 10889]|uniref:hybrid sensor histidine kinase/response regulator n=1 Tax=Acinetobacter sp. CFCC 10889 TaxID=1775557 RepID=UPI000DD033C8|nr:Hpt domain-containing protein [Acinetobacter sp. CFCC 10889]